MSAPEMPGREVPASPRLAAAVAELGATLAAARPLAGDGSDRRFFRLLGSPPVVLLSHPQAPGREVNENDSYAAIGRHLRDKGVPVPEIYAYCREEGWLLVEDVGDLSLEAALGQRPADWRRLYAQALTVLVRLQLEGREGFDPAWCFDTGEVTREFLWARECRYFVEAFLRGYLGLAVEEADLAQDFARLVEGALPPGPAAFLHRDFQSRNLFFQGENLRVLDFQGGRLGPLGYDLAALLIDPYVELGEAREAELFDVYLGELRRHRPVNARDFREAYAHLALCRNLQILGAFGFLTRVKGKPWFAPFIPAALRSLKRRLAALPGRFPALARLAAAICP